MTPLRVFQRVLLRTSVPCGRQMSTDSNEVLFDVKNDKRGFITLNRPKALNTLTACMVQMISCKLTEWEKQLDYIVVRGTGRAFCAGGDIVQVTKCGPLKAELGEDFFRREYAMNYKISECSIPYIAIIDGFTMGGGVGLSVHGKYRIATENTMFAMPETQIGLFPDVGGSYFLSRMGTLGLYLALTGHRLQGIDVAKAGIATHFMDSKNIPQLLQDLENVATKATVEEILNKHSKCLKSHYFSLDTKMELIESAFGASSLEEIVDILRTEGSEWSLTTLKTLGKMSPTSLKITFRELQEGKSKTLKECLQMEYRLAVGALRAKISGDFYEGVRALLIDKDKKPVWNPPSIEAVSNEMLNVVFDKLPCPRDELIL